MLVLFETAAGFAVFKLLNEKKLKKVDQLFEDFQKPDEANSILQLVQFRKFKDSVEALEAANASVEGKVSKPLKKLLKKLIIDKTQEDFAVADAKLASNIKEKFNLNCLANNNIQELMRCIRSQSENLISGIDKKEMAAWELSLAHSLSRYKLKFSPDKVDTMVVQAIKILDELDKKVNNNVMTVKQWYGWHFPELEKNVTDNMTLVQTIRKLGFRSNTAETDLSDVLPDGLDAKVKQEAEVSIGTDIAPDDLEQVLNMCDEVITWSDARAELYDYLRNRMAVIAPNLTVMLGELVGARLIAHAGSLLNLSKCAASTVQILGAEKALFRALKTKHDTPKYGLIYHASLVGQCNPKYKGKIARMLAAKTSLAVRCDAMSEDVIDTEIAIESKAKLERRMLSMDEDKKLSGSGKKRPQFDKYENKSVIKSTPGGAGGDSTLPKKRKAEAEPEMPVKKMKMDLDTTAEESVSTTPAEKKKKKKRKSEGDVPDPETPVAADSELTEEGEGQKKKKKRKKHESEDQ